MRSLNEVLEEINLEARNGVVDCGLKHWIYYSVYDNKDGEYVYENVLKKYRNVVPPCLKIGDREGLLEVIGEYLEIAESFYDELDYDRVEDVDKYTIATVLSNMMVDDFSKPIEFFKKRISFLQDDTLKRFKRCRDIGYSKVFDANIEVELIKEAIFMETPYAFSINIVKYTEDGRKMSYPLPLLRFAICEDKAYFYAIQKDQDIDLPDDKEYISFSKKIRRKMYSIGKGLSESERTNTSIENINEVSPWAVIALTITLGLLKSLGIKDVLAFPLLINRYNSNVIYSFEELKVLKDKNEEIYKDIKEHLLFIAENIDNIQENITDKFIRTFRRVAYHFPGIEMDDFPVVAGLPLEMSVNGYDNCNNPLLEEMFNLGLCYNSEEKQKEVG